MLSVAEVKRFTDPPSCTFSNYLQVSEDWRQEHAPFLDTLELEAPTLTPKRQHAVRRLHGQGPADDGAALVASDQVLYSLPPTDGESDTAKHRRKDRHLKREQGAIRRIDAALERAADRARVTAKQALVTARVVEKNKQLRAEARAERAAAKAEEALQQQQLEASVAQLEEGLNAMTCGCHPTHDRTVPSLGPAVLSVLERARSELEEAQAETADAELAWKEADAYTADGLDLKGRYEEALARLAAAQKAAPASLLALLHSQDPSQEEVQRELDHELKRQKAELQEMARVEEEKRLLCAFGKLYCTRADHRINVGCWGHTMRRELGYVGVSTEDIGRRHGCNVSCLPCSMCTTLMYIQHCMPAESQWPATWPKEWDLAVDLLENWLPHRLRRDSLRLPLELEQRAIQLRWCAPPAASFFDERLAELTADGISEGLQISMDSGESFAYAKSFSFSLRRMLQYLKEFPTFVSHLKDVLFKKERVALHTAMAATKDAEARMRAALDVEKARAQAAGVEANSAEVKKLKALWEWKAKVEQKEADNTECLYAVFAPSPADRGCMPEPMCND